MCEPYIRGVDEISIAKRNLGYIYFMSKFWDLIDTVSTQISNNYGISHTDQILEYDFDNLDLRTVTVEHLRRSRYQSIRFLTFKKNIISGFHNS